ncbi:MBL fold metallo-hydrolase [Salinimicrobium sp. GXAS 041]|uniref:MBL fold metallo-hydrolase n=1 Tax=Salinimicrobium sp. GXAS 041 TaxID=3400806 RepID=UPI003C73DDF0
MKIKVLGSRGKIEPSALKYQNHSGFLIDDKILIDVGEREFMTTNPEAIVFTHFHPDHAFFVSEEKKFTPEIPLFGPQEHPLIPNLKLISGKFDILGYSFTPVPVIHALKLKSLGYIVEKDKKRAFFTGDVAWIEKAYLQKIEKVDVVITEATMINKGGRINRKKDKIFGHTGVPDLVRILSPLTNRIIFTHFGDWFFENVEKSPKILKDFSTPHLGVIPAFDGLEFSL